MKRILYTLTTLFIGCFLACTPDKDKVLEMGMIDMDLVKTIKLRMSHFQLLCNGKAQLEFNPLLSTENWYDEVPDSRVDHSRIEYYTTGGEILPKVLSTSDKSLIGKTIDVYAKIKGTGLLSDTTSFTVMDASIPETYTEITVPIVFHLIQSNKDITEYGGEIPMERIYLLLDKINHTFSGAVSHNATGVDTKIRFKPAVYDPFGRELSEAGINRITVEKVIDENQDQYNTFILKQNALWPYDKYLNVWLVSDRDNEYSNFFYDITKNCIPRYLNSGTSAPFVPEGLSLSPLPADWSPLPNETGILYRLQSLLSVEFTFNQYGENELVNAIGLYLGLLPTWGAGNPEWGYDPPEDYCPDTHKYFGEDYEGYQLNKTAYKLVGDCFFLAENIMDDPVGVHRSVSLQQAQRIRWILKNCPERSAWKSGYAFTGQ